MALDRAHQGIDVPIRVGGPAPAVTSPTVIRPWGTVLREQIAREDPDKGGQGRSVEARLAFDVVLFLSKKWIAGHLRRQVFMLTMVSVFLLPEEYLRLLP
jgi:hypothetical protein